MKMLMLEILLQYLLFLIKIVSIESVRVLDKGILPLEKNSIGIQFYLNIENEDRLMACKLRSRPEICCLSDNSEIDCDNIEVYGDYNDVLKPKYRDTVLYIYPTMAQHDQIGHCNFFLEYRCGRTKNKRETVRIPFDTRLKKKSQYLLKGYTNGQKITTCDTLDQDSLNQCSPVNCDIKYSGSRPFYDRDLDKCVKAVECLTDLKQQMPDLVYMPKSNTCRDLSNPLSVSDIYALSTGLGIIREPLENNEFKITLKSNCSTISQNLMFLKDLLYGKLYPMKTDFSKSCNTAILSILTCIIVLSLALLLFVLFANITAWAHRKWRTGELNKNIEDLKKQIRSSRSKKCKNKASRTDSEIKNKLLRDVIVSDLPLELRGSVVDICERLDKEVRGQKRHGKGDRGSQVHFQDNCDTSTTSDLDYEEQQRLLE